MPALNLTHTLERPYLVLLLAPRLAPRSACRRFLLLLPILGAKLLKHLAMARLRVGLFRRLAVVFIILVIAELVLLLVLTAPAMPRLACTLLVAATLLVRVDIRIGQIQAVLLQGKPLVLVLVLVVLILMVGVTASSQQLVAMRAICLVIVTVILIVLLLVGVRVRIMRLLALIVIVAQMPSALTVAVTVLRLLL